VLGGGFCEFAEAASLDAGVPGEDRGGAVQGFDEGLRDGGSWVALPLCEVGAVGDLAALLEGVHAELHRDRAEGAAAVPDG